MEICRLVNVKKTYEAGEEVTPILQADLTINSGDFISIVGPSGIGKSTLLQIMGGISYASSGDIYITGKNIKTLSDKELTEIRRLNIGFIFQESNLIQALTIKENLVFAQALKGAERNMEKVEHYLNRMGLWERKDFLPCEISGGQRRRAMAACALIKDPLLILADEPTNDLDEHFANIIMNMLSECACGGKAVVLVTHNSVWAERAHLRYELIQGILHKKH